MGHISILHARVGSTRSQRKKENGWKITSGQTFLSNCATRLNMEKKLATWIDRSAAHPGIASEIHIDEISKKYMRPKTWITGTVDLLREANTELKAEGIKGVIVAAFTLRSFPEYQGANYADRKQLAAQFEMAPPSLYHFLTVRTLLLKKHRCISINVKTFPLPSQSWSLLHCEYKEKTDVEYRRSLWLIPLVMMVEPKGDGSIYCETMRVSY